MKAKPRILADILKDYFQHSQEPLAKEFRRYFNITAPNLNEVSDERINEMIENTILEDWIDNQDVMQTLHISPRTLQTLRSNGTLPYSRIQGKIYYLRQDVQKLLANNYSMIKIRNYGKNM
jgi:hypothetical protein